MASDTPHKQEFRIRDLSTRSLLLFPTQAQIIRDIKDIALQPGPNQIIIDGLAPTVDEHSIKVEGTGAATISEVTVDLLPNRDVYEDIYPSESEDEDDDEDSESDEEPESLKAIVAKIKELNVALLDQYEKTNSAAQRLRICDNFGDSLIKDRPPYDELEKLLAAYNAERVKIFVDHSTSTAASNKIKEEIKKCEKEKKSLVKHLVKAQLKAKKESQKLKEKKLKQKAEIHKEKLRIKAERISFWPKKVYRITISLEPTTNTPGSSRRSSVDGDTIVEANLASTTFHEPSKVMPGEISLSLSYLTNSASWSPRYDLSLNSVKCTGVLDYGAELRNTTSETWRDAKVILSTSQTTFSGLSETIPTLLPWHVKLQKGRGNTDWALFSNAEMQAKRAHWDNTVVQSQKPRNEIFGVDESARNLYLKEHSRAAEKKKKETSTQVNSFLNKMAAQPAPPPGGSLFSGAGLFGAQNQQHRQGALFGASSAAPPPAPMSRHRARDVSEHAEHEYEEETEHSDDYMGYGLFDAIADLAAPAPNSLVFEEGAWDETGMTTTYDVPGLKTIAPSNSTIKHKIAKISFSNIIFSHIVIGKLRQVAFLKARLRNASKITLLKGPLGITLDDSFLGRASLPRCSAGETISLPLGVDPAIQISYPKPTVHRSQSGIFTKEDSNVFTRTIVITNTKHTAPVELTVLDQVPVSEDERLRIEIVTPKGLKIGGDKVRAGANATDSNDALSVGGSAKSARASVYNAAGKEVGREGAWGKADAVAKKGGEVAWNVKLMPGCGVKLSLEYEMTFPGNEGVVGV